MQYLELVPKLSVFSSFYVRVYKQKPYPLLVQKSCGSGKVFPDTFSGVSFSLDKFLISQTTVSKSIEEKAHVDFYTLTRESSGATRVNESPAVTLTVLGKSSQSA